VSEAQILQAHRVDALVDAHGDAPEYAYRLVRDESENNGWVTSRRTASRLAPAHDQASGTVRRRGRLCCPCRSLVSIFPRNTAARWGASHCCNPRCRVRSAADKAAMESFSDLQRKIVLSQRTWTTREQLCLAVVTWIEAMHHGSRRQDGLVGSTLLELGAIMLQ